MNSKVKIIIELMASSSMAVSQKV